MDMSQYAGSAFIKLSDVEGHPIRATIVGVSQGKWDKPNLLLSDGSKFSANKQNCRILLRAYGKDDADWIGQEIELFAGEIEFQKEMKPAVVVRPISSPTVAPQANGDDSEPDGDKPKADYDDVVPF
jgi:hypothetical protein